MAEPTKNDRKTHESLFDDLNIDDLLARLADWDPGDLLADLPELDIDDLLGDWPVDLLPDLLDGL